MCRHFVLGVAYGVGLGLALGIALDLGDVAVGYVKPTIGRLHP